MTHLEARSHRLQDLASLVLLLEWWWLGGNRRRKGGPELRWRRVEVVLLLGIVIVHMLIVIIVPALTEDVLEVVVDLLSQIEFVLVDQRLVQGVEQVRQASIHLVLR